MNFTSFWSDVAATILGGAVLTLLFFWAKEHLFPLPRVTGRWNFEIRTATTSYAPYRGMILRYVAVLCQEGTRVEGTVEKIYENSVNGERSFVGKNRTRGVVSGYIEKNYAGRDRVILHVVEDGHGRESTNYYELTTLQKGTMGGAFTSMVADQSGTVRWQRAQF